MSNAVTLNSNALITYDNVREYMKMKEHGQENAIKRQINIVSDMIEGYCGRPFKARKIWNEIHRDVSEVQLKAYPIQKIPTINSGYDVLTQTGTVDSGTTSTLVDSALTEADDYWNGGMLSVELSSNSWEKARIDDFDAGTDTITVLSEDAFSEAPASGENYEIALWDKSSYYQLVDSDIKEIDYDCGIVTLFGKYKVLVVDYYGGYQTIPDDIVAAAVFQTLEYLSPMANMNIQSMTVGGSTAQFRSGNKIQGLNPKVKFLLDRHRVLHV